jgi:hypothetical protein
MRRRSVLAAALVATGSGCIIIISCFRRSNVSIPTEQTEDTVREFRSQGAFVIVFFRQLAGEYRLAVNRDDFVQQLALLAGSYKSQQPVSLTLRYLDIERVSELRPTR